MDINTLPYVPQVHLFESELNTHLLLANGSQIYGIDEDLGKRFKEAIRCYDNELVDRLLEENGLQTAPRITNEPPKNIKLHSISLAVAQKCNLGCTYCYAQEGSFGGAAKNMSLHTAFRSVDMLLEKMEDGEKAHITYLGGEPLINRELIHKTTEYAKRLATSRGIQLGFSLTTNGTLIEAVDMYFFEEHGFAVTISIDGIGEIHDRLRPNKGGKGSYDNIIKRVSPMLKMQRNMQVSARVTVTPKNLALTQTLDELVGLGFHSVGFSPMLSSPTGREEMDISSLELMLAQMIECGETFEKNMLLGKRYPFSNMVNALKEIHKGTHRPYPCGAGAGYMGISADGDLAACHRFVGDNEGAMGNIFDGKDELLQNDWLTNRHVHQQEPCKSCWARYLCGGGCHHEVIHKGRPACDFIRGWLHYCLQAYVRLLEKTPGYFG